jgi:hypothetical protein
MLLCRLLGHRFRSVADGNTMRWDCERGCGAGASKEYPTPGDAERYARAFDREDRSELGRRAPFGLFALRLLPALRERRRAHGPHQ